MARSLKAEFFSVETPGPRPAAFAGVLQTLQGTPIAHRNQQVSDYYLRLQTVASRRTQWHGDVVRIRMDYVPNKASLAGSLTPIALAANEGVGEETAFLYDEPTQTLVLQRHKPGASPSAFAAYFEAASGIHPIILHPCLQSSALERLAKLTKPRKLRIRIAPLNQLDAFKGHGLSLETLANLSNQFKSPTLEVSISMGHSRGSLEPRAISSTVKALLGIRAKSEEVIRTLQISGRTEDLEADFIDLLAERIQETVDLPDGTPRAVPDRVRWEALDKAWDRRWDELRSMAIEP